jgi:hypothetical protein
MLSEFIVLAKKTLKRLFSDKFFFLCVPFLVLMFMLVFIGNPKIPVQSLADMGIGWHHIPEVVGFFFCGMWCGVLPALYSETSSSETFSWRDPVSFFITIISTSLIGLVLVQQSLEVVILYAIIPSSFGFVVRRGIMLEILSSAHT